MLYIRPYFPKSIIKDFDSESQYSVFIWKLFVASFK